MKTVTNAYVVWLMQQTRLVRYFIIALMLHVALLVVLGSIKIVAIVPSIVAKFTGTALPPPSNEVPDDPYAVYRDFDYSGPTLGGGGGLGGKGPGGVPTAGGKASILTAETKSDAATVGEVISVFSENATAITRPAGTPGSVGIMAGIGDGIGTAGVKGPGGPWLGAGRMGPQRSVNLKKYGGSLETERAVLGALRWLKAHQEPDGSWKMGSYAQSAACLAILAFCGHGETPDSAEFGATLTKAFEYLVRQVKPDGNACAGGGMYDQGLAGLALAEAYAMTSSPILKAPLEKVTKFIIQAQKTPKKNPIHAGGWRYAPTSPDADVSAAGWQIMALKSAKSAGIEVDKHVMEKAADYLWNMYQAPGFGYDHPGCGPALTAVGVLCQQFLGNGSDKRLRPALDYLDKLKMDWGAAKGGGFVLYRWYYQTQAMFQGGRSHWTAWNATMRDVLLRNQKEDGHWDLPPNDGELDFVKTPVYSTTLCTLMLEVYYRYLPMYQITDTTVAQETGPRPPGALPQTGLIPTAPGG